MLAMLMLNTSDLGRKLKHDMQYCLKIRRLPIPEGGLELNFLGRANRGLVQSVAKTLHDFHDVNLPGGREDNVHQDSPLNLELSSLFSVNRTGLVSDLRRQRSNNRLG